MGSFSIWHWMIVLVVILIVFGAGKLPRVMGDAAKGIKAFRAGMKDDDPVEEITPPAEQTASATPAGSNGKSTVEGTR